MLSAMLFMPNFSAILRASPSSASVGRPPFCRTTSMSTHRTPRLQPVPSAFIAASFTANRPAYRSYLFLNRSQYSRSLAVKIRRKNTSPCRSIAPRMRSTSAMSIPMPTITAWPPLAQSNPVHPRFISDYTGQVVTRAQTLRPKRRVRKNSMPPASQSHWTERTSHGIRILQVDVLRKLPWLVHGFSTRPGGISGVHDEKVLNLGFTDWDTRENV